MPQRESAEPVSATDADATQQLLNVLQSLTKEVEALKQQVGTLTDSAQILTAAIDDVRMEIEYAVRNLNRPQWVPTPGPNSIGHEYDDEVVAATMSHTAKEPAIPEAEVAHETPDSSPQPNLWD